MLGTEREGEREEGESGRRGIERGEERESGGLSGRDTVSTKVLRDRKVDIPQCLL